MKKSNQQTEFNLIHAWESLPIYIRAYTVLLMNIGTFLTLYLINIGKL